MISVIVPIFNVEKHLIFCLERLSSQTFSDVEFILIDDGSTDNSGKIADDYASDSRFRVFHTENRGLSSVRNMGIQAARGEWVMFVDGDDYVTPDFCDISYHAAINNAADLVIFRYYYVKNGKVHISAVKPIGIVTHETAIEYGDSFVWNKLYKRKLFASIQFPENMVHEDLAVTHKLIYNATRIVIISDVLYYYVYRRESISNSHALKVKKDGFILVLQKSKDLKAYGYPDELCNRELVPNAIGYLICAYPDESELFREAENVISSIKGVPPGLSSKRKVMLTIWRADKSLFHHICKWFGKKQLV